MTESKPIGISTQREIDIMFHRPVFSNAELREIASTQELRQALVSEHNLIGHPGGVKRAGCAYCYAPGRLGDYQPPEALPAVTAYEETL